jgi:hypothetical protein
MSSQAQFQIPPNLGQFGLFAKDSITTVDSIYTFGYNGAAFYAGFIGSSHGELTTSDALYLDAVVEFDSLKNYFYNQSATVLANLNGLNLNGGGSYKITQSFTLNDTLKLNGDSLTFYFFRIEGDFNLDSNAVIILSGGVTANNVIFYVESNLRYNTAHHIEGVFLVSNHIDLMSSMYSNVALWAGGNISTLKGCQASQKLEILNEFCAQFCRTTCNIIPNGGFQGFLAGANTSGNPYLANLVCCWNCTHGSPSLLFVGPTTSNTAAAIWTGISGAGEGIYTTFGNVIIQGTNYGNFIPPNTRIVLRFRQTRLNGTSNDVASCTTSVTRYELVQTSTQDLHHCMPGGGNTLPGGAVTQLITDFTAPPPAGTWTTACQVITTDNNAYDGLRIHNLCGFNAIDDVSISVLPPQTLNVSLYCGAVYEMPSICAINPQLVWGSNNLNWNTTQYLQPNVNQFLEFNASLTPGPGTYTYTASFQVCGNTLSTVVNITVLPTVPPVITNSNLSRCANSGDQITYTLTNYNPNATGYQWILVNGSFVNGTSTSQTITVNWDSNEDGILQFVVCRDTFTYHFPRCCRVPDNLTSFVTIYPGNFSNSNALIALNGNNTTLSNKNIAINGTFDYNQSMSWEDCNVWLGTNAAILLNGTAVNPVDFQLKGTHIQACHKMWDRIEANNSNESLTILDNNNSPSIIEDGIYATIAFLGGKINARNSIFNKNYQQISMGLNADLAGSSITGCTIQCNDLQSQNPVLLKPPYDDRRSETGLALALNSNSFNLGGTGVNDKNNFINNNIQIQAVATNLSIVNTDFFDSYTTANIYTSPGLINPIGGVDISFTSWGSSANTLHINPNNNSQEKCNFSNSNVGVFVRGKCRTYIYGNDFYKADYGVIVNQAQGVPFASGTVTGITSNEIAIENNYFNLMNRVGIYGAENTRAVIKVNDNFLNNQSRFGIYFANTFAPHPALGSDITLNKNSIGGPIMQNGIFVSNFKSPQILNNNIVYQNPSMSSNPNSQSLNRGITMIAALGKAQILQNFITRNGTATIDANNAETLRGIQCEHSPNTLICSNILNKMGQGIRLVQNNLGTKLLLNVMLTNYQGVRFSYAPITSQGTHNYFYKNQWVNNISTYKMGGEVICQGTVLWSYNTTNSPNYSPCDAGSSPCAWVDVIQVNGNGIFVIDISANNGPNSCNGGVGAFPPAMQAGGREYTELDSNFVEEDSTALAFMDKQFLYRDIMGDSLIMQSDPNTLNDTLLAYRNYVLSRNQSIEGRYYRIIELLLSDSLYEAQSLQLLLSDSVPQAAALRIVLEIYSNTWAHDTVDIDEEQFMILWTIANDSPLILGEAVYAARTMIGLMGADIDTRRTPQKQDIAQKEKAESIHLWPNPTNDELNIAQTDTDVERSIWVSISDLKGTPVRNLKMNLQNSTTEKIHLRDLSHGVYIVQVRDMAGNKILVRKIIKL